jgi:hypothetical protein
MKPVVQLHNGFLQYRASQKYMANDDVDLEGSLEILQDILTIHKGFLVTNRLVANLFLFRTWFAKDPKNSLIQNWKMLLADYWFYHQTGLFPREYWTSEVSILSDLKILFIVSQPYLQAYKKGGLQSSL